MEGHYAPEGMENFGFRLASVITGLNAVESAETGRRVDVSSDSSNKNSRVGGANLAGQSNLSTSGEVGGPNFPAGQSDSSVKKGEAADPASPDQSDLPTTGSDVVIGGAISSVQSDSTAVNNAKIDPAFSDQSEVSGIEKSTNVVNPVDQSNSSPMNVVGGANSVDQSNSTSIDHEMGETDSADQSNLSTINEVGGANLIDQSNLSIENEVDQSNLATENELGGAESTDQSNSTARGDVEMGQSDSDVDEDDDVINDQSNSSATNEVGGADQSLMPSTSKKGGTVKKRGPRCKKIQKGVTDEQRKAMVLYVVAKIRQAAELAGTTRVRLVPSFRSKQFWESSRRDPVARRFTFPARNPVNLGLEFTFGIIPNLTEYLSDPDDRKLFLNYLNRPAETAIPVTEIFPPKPKPQPKKICIRSGGGKTSVGGETSVRGTSVTAEVSEVPSDITAPFTESERMAMCQFAIQRFRNALLIGGPEAAWKVHPASPATWQRSEVGFSAENLNFRWKEPQTMAAEFAFHIKLNLASYVENEQDLELLNRHWYTVPKYCVRPNRVNYKRLVKANRKKRAAEARRKKRQQQQPIKTAKKTAKSKSKSSKQQSIKTDQCRCHSNGAFFCGVLTYEERSAMCRFVARKLREAVETNDPAAIRLAHPGLPFVWRLVGDPHQYEYDGDGRGFRLKKPNQMASEFTLHIKPNLYEYLRNQRDRKLINHYWPLDREPIKKAQTVKRRYYMGTHTEDEYKAIARYAARKFRLAVESRDYELIRLAHPGHVDVWRLVGAEQSTAEERGFRLKKPNSMAYIFRGIIKPNLGRYLENDEDICVLEFNWYLTSEQYKKYDERGARLLTPKDMKDAHRLERLIDHMHDRAAELIAVNRALRNQLCLQKLTNFDQYLCLQRENRQLENLLNIRNDEDLSTEWNRSLEMLTEVNEEMLTDAADDGGGGDGAEMNDLLTDVNENSSKADKCLQTEIFVIPRNYDLHIQQLKKMIAALEYDRVHHSKFKNKNGPSVQEITIE